MALLGLTVLEWALMLPLRTRCSPVSYSNLEDYLRHGTSIKKLSRRDFMDGRSRMIEHLETIEVHIKHRTHVIKLYSGCKCL